MVTISTRMNIVNGCSSVIFQHANRIPWGTALAGVHTHCLFCLFYARGQEHTDRHLYSPQLNKLNTHHSLTQHTPQTHAGTQALTHTHACAHTHTHTPHRWPTWTDLPGHLSAGCSTACSCLQLLHEDVIASAQPLRLSCEALILQINTQETSDIGKSKTDGCRRRDAGVYVTGHRFGLYGK